MTKPIMSDRSFATSDRLLVAELEQTVRTQQQTIDELQVENAWLRQ